MMVSFDSLSGDALRQVGEYLLEIGSHPQQHLGYILDVQKAISDLMAQPYVEYPLIANKVMEKAKKLSQMRSKRQQAYAKKVALRRKNPLKQNTQKAGKKKSSELLDKQTLKEVATCCFMLEIVRLGKQWLGTSTVKGISSMAKMLGNSFMLCAEAAPGSAAPLTTRKMSTWESMQTKVEHVRRASIVVSSLVTLLALASITAPAPVLVIGKGALFIVQVDKSYKKFQLAVRVSRFAHKVLKACGEACAKQMRLVALQGLRTTMTTVMRLGQETHGKREPPLLPQ